MLQNLSERIRLCYERALEAREHAEATNDPETKAQYLQMEERWLLLVRSNEFSESLDKFIRAAPKPQLPHPFSSHSLLLATGAAVFAKDKESRMIVANTAYLNLIGKSWNEVRGRNDEQWHSDLVQASQILSNDKLVIESQQTHVYEERFTTPLGLRIVLSTKSPLLDDDGHTTGVVGVATDITERNKREERGEFLREELRHRLKNTIAVVRAMARHSIDPGDGLSRFEDRLSAYARSQDLVHGQDAVSLHALIAAQLHSLPAENRLDVDGPDIVLPAHFAVEIGIALHELITNSIKYGALGGNGCVEVWWIVQTCNERRYLLLSWHEQHDRVQADAPREGFGHKVLRRAVAYNLSGVASLDIAPGEVNWTLRAEL